MTGGLRSFSLFVLGCLIALVVMAMLGDREDHAAASKAEMAAVMRVATPEPRLRYPENEALRIALPGGRQEMVRSVLNITKQMRFGDYVWDENGIAQGPVWVRVDLERQLISVFRDGHEIGSAVILYGTDGKPTPTGSFPILEKDADHHSRTYDAPMPYMLRLTNDGVAIHASNVREGWATHGCIGIPMAFARKLFAQAHMGDMVAILPAGTTAAKS